MAKEQKKNKYGKQAAASVAAAGTGLLVSRGLTVLGAAAGGPVGAIIGAAAGAVASGLVTDLLNERIDNQQTEEQS